MTKAPSTGHSMTSSSLDMLHVGLGRSVSISPCAQHSEAKQKCQSLEERKDYCKAL